MLNVVCSSNKASDTASFKYRQPYSPLLWKSRKKNALGVIVVATVESYTLFHNYTAPFCLKWDQTVIPLPKGGATVNTEVRNEKHKQNCNIFFTQNLPLKIILYSHNLF